MRKFYPRNCKRRSFSNAWPLYHGQYQNLAFFPGARKANIQPVSRFYTFSIEALPISSFPGSSSGGRTSCSTWPDQTMIAWEENYRLLLPGRGDFLMTATAGEMNTNVKPKYY